jgi:hypothetical protein
MIGRHGGLGAGQDPSCLVGEHPTATWAEIKTLAK